MTPNAKMTGAQHTRCAFVSSDMLDHISALNGNAKSERQEKCGQEILLRAPDEGNPIEK
jgi:hypothetical protein